MRDGRTVQVWRCRQMPCLPARPFSAEPSSWKAHASPTDVSTRPSQPLHPWGLHSLQAFKQRFQHSGRSSCAHHV